MENDFLNESQEYTEAAEQLELPEGIELLERPEPQEAQEAPQPQLETKELSEGLEVDTLTKERQEMAEESPYSYSESYIDQNGMYHPEQVNGVYSDAVKDPQCQQMMKELNVWEHQQENLSCAVQCQRMVVADRLELDVTEAELRNQGKENGWYSSFRGTLLNDVGKLAESYGLEYEQSRDFKLEDLVAAKETGNDVIIAVDATLLAYPFLEKTCTPNHAVEVIGFDFSDQENPKVILNDPGREDGRGSTYPLSIFEKAACATDMETGEQKFHFMTTIHNKEVTL